MPLRSSFPLVLAFGIIFMSTPAFSNISHKSLLSKPFFSIPLASLCLIGRFSSFLIYQPVCSLCVTVFRVFSVANQILPFCEFSTRVCAHVIGIAITFPVYPSSFVIISSFLPKPNLKLSLIETQRCPSTNFDNTQHLLSPTGSAFPTSSSLPQVSPFNL